MPTAPDQASAEQLFLRLPGWARLEISTNTKRFALLMGVLEGYRPVRMAEVGVSAGSLSAALLYKARQYSMEARLVGIDLGETCSFEGPRKIGGVIQDAFPELLPAYDLHTGKTSLDAEAILPSPLDFAYIDANHEHPWAAIDCLCLLPHLADTAIIGFHDTAVAANRHCSGLFTYRSFLTEKFDDEQWDAQGSGFCLYKNTDTELVLNSLLRAFAFPWDTQVDPTILRKVVEKSSTHYGTGFASKLAEVFAFWTENLGVILALRQKQNEQLMAQYTTSTSWRVTRPLRWISSAAGALRAGKS
jgi:hypothetical protein